MSIAFGWTNPTGAPPTGGGVLYYNGTNVGIGNTLPGHKLDVTGDINLSGVFRKGGSAGISSSCGIGNIFDGLTVSGGIITSAGACAAIGAGMAVPPNKKTIYTTCEQAVGAPSNLVKYLNNPGNSIVSRNGVTAWHYRCERYHGGGCNTTFASNVWYRADNGAYLDCQVDAGNTCAEELCNVPPGAE